ncbi:leucine-rich repeat neuronal protein 1-like [Chrysoperla carnea]|uniref:leucine-rich repeat neuronal protein 1-like n=1 Tax=Chrysoperla carnea TaxID=189513 RepID=UPI001D0606B8|nr:leucine-rich repeat neuronal protein 1-like [Chrysoperla carnea]XP_044729824.1 leucine-rich repeat neuronal protein 1-like [Chrysoperla carnea]
MYLLHLLLTICAIILQVAQSANPKCNLDGKKLVCTDVNSNEFIQNIKKYQPTDIKCAECTFSKLNLQQLDIEIRKKLQNIEIIELLDELDFDVTTFKGVENLQTLTIVNTSIKTMEQKLFKPLSKLQEVHFIQCNARKRVDFGFKYTPQLRKLSITQTFIYHVLDKWFHYIKNLQELDFSDSRIQTIDKKSFKALTKLQKIVLRKNDIKVLPTELFDNNLELKYLDVSHNPINQINIKHLIETNKELEEFLMYDLPCQTFESKAESLQFVTEYDQEEDNPLNHKLSCVNLQAYDKRVPNKKITVFRQHLMDVVSDNNFNGLPCVSGSKFKNIFEQIPIY